MPLAPPHPLHSTRRPCPARPSKAGEFWHHKLSIYEKAFSIISTGFPILCRKEADRGGTQLSLSLSWNSISCVRSPPLVLFTTADWLLMIEIWQRWILAVGDGQPTREATTRIITFYEQDSWLSHTLQMFRQCQKHLRDVFLNWSHRWMVVVLAFLLVGAWRQQNIQNHVMMVSVRRIDYIHRKQLEYVHSGHHYHLAP